MQLGKNLEDFEVKTEMKESLWKKLADEWTSKKLEIWNIPVLVKFFSSS